MTGFYRDGCGATEPEDLGSYTVCSIMTPEFLEFSLLAGNDLSTPRPEWGFPGLSPGLQTNADERWLERARAFAMHAIEQVEEARREHGRGLWVPQIRTAVDEARVSGLRA